MKKIELLSGLFPPDSERLVRKINELIHSVNYHQVEHGKNKFHLFVTPDFMDMDKIIKECEHDWESAKSLVDKGYYEEGRVCMKCGVTEMGECQSGQHIRLDGKEPKCHCGDNLIKKCEKILDECSKLYNPSIRVPKATRNISCGDYVYGKDLEF